MFSCNCNRVSFLRKDDFLPYSVTNTTVIQFIFKNIPLNFYHLQLYLKAWHQISFLIPFALVLAFPCFVTFDCELDLLVLQFPCIFIGVNKVLWNDFFSTSLVYGIMSELLLCCCNSFGLTSKQKCHIA